MPPRFLMVSFLSALLSAASVPGAEQAWKVGLARAVITPKQPVWLSGYAGKRVPQGKLHDLWVKVLTLEDANGRRAAILTTDLIGFSKVQYDDLCAALEQKYHLKRDQLMLTFSHTHSGPILRESLIDYFPLDDDTRRLIAGYSHELERTIVQTIGESLRTLAPAKLFVGSGLATFAVNRRNNPESQVPQMLAQGKPLRGPVDHSVPLLVVRKPAGDLRALVFGYACHNTTLSGTDWCGDYAGFAQEALEKNHPGVQAMFWTGCGADQNPIPRRRAELAQQYGQMLAEGVDKALQESREEVAPSLRTSYTIIQLPYEKMVSRDLLKAAEREDSLRGRWARRLQQRQQAGEKLATRDHYDYPIQAWRLGNRQLWLALAGEVVVDFALRFKEEYGPGTWVTAYVNDMVAYIPSRRVWLEGGYEGAGVYEYGLPAERWTGDVEERVAAAVKKLVRQVQGPSSPLSAQPLP